MRGSPIERFLSKIQRAPSGCWVWTAGHFPKGYGVFRVAGRSVSAHRWAYEHFVGLIPAGLQIDHLCRNKGCVNPKHLEVVTNRENSQRRTRLITHCPQGHEYTEENTYLWGELRYCRSCHVEHNRSWRNRVRA